MQFETLARHGPWTVLHLPGESPDLVLSCASIGHDLTRAPAPEWARSATVGNRPALFLQDASRSWATAPGLAEVLHAALASLSPARRVVALGSSMGAFTALAVSRILPLDALIAIGPQHRPAAPQEPRWTDLTATLPPTLTAPISRATRTYILHAEDDLPQAMGFSDPDQRIFPGQTHSSLARHLKPAMPGLIEAALTADRRRFLRLIAQAGGLPPRRFFAEKSAPCESAS